jgi:hypothetical protein
MPLARAKCDRRFRIERDVELAERFVSVEVAADAVERRLFFSVGESKACDLFGAFERVLAHTRRRRAAALRRDG